MGRGGGGGEGGGLSGDHLIMPYMEAGAHELPWAPDGSSEGL